MRVIARLGSARPTCGGGPVRAGSRGHFAGAGGPGRAPKPCTEPAAAGLEPCGFRWKCSWWPENWSYLRSTRFLFPFFLLNTQWALCFDGSRQRRGVTGYVLSPCSLGRRPAVPILPARNIASHLLCHPLRAFGSRVEMVGGSCHTLWMVLPTLVVKPLGRWFTAFQSARGSHFTPTYFPAHWQVIPVPFLAGNAGKSNFFFFKFGTFKIVFVWGSSDNRGQWGNLIESCLVPAPGWLLGTPRLHRHWVGFLCISGFVTSWRATPKPLFSEYLCIMRKYFKMIVRWPVELFNENKFFSVISFYVGSYSIFWCIMNIILNCVMCHFKQNISPQAYGVLYAINSFKFPLVSAYHRTHNRNFWPWKLSNRSSICVSFYCAVWMQIER